jgi:membrane-bound serine protease (ClpP class)
MDPLTIAYVLIAIGLALLVAEIFIPSGGLLFVASSAAIIAGVVMAFLYGDSSTGFLTLVGVFIIVPVLATAMLYLWPRTAVGKRFILPDQDATLAQMPVNLELEQLRGRYGQALSDLRPAGVASFDGKRIDVITEGMMVAAGAWVRCVDVKAGKVVVRQVDKPRLQDLESADFT